MTEDLSPNNPELPPAPTPEPAGGGEVQPVAVITPEAIVEALRIQQEQEREREQKEARDRAAARQKEREAVFEEMLSLMAQKAEEHPLIRDTRTNKYLTAPPDTRTQAERHAKYARYPKRIRWGIAARDGVSYVPGHGGPLDPTSRRDQRRSLKAYRRAARAVNIEANIRMAEREPGDRHGGFELDPRTGKSIHRDSEGKLRGMPRSRKGSIRWSERHYARLRRKARRDNSYLARGSALGDYLDSFEPVDSTPRETHLRPGNESFVAGAIRLIKNGYDKAKPLFIEAFIRLKEAAGNGIVSSKVAYHGLASYIARTRMERAGSTMEQLEHEQALFFDDPDTPRSIKDVELDEVLPRSKQERKLRSDIEDLSEEDQKKLKEIRAKRREDAIERIKEQRKQANAHDKQAAQNRKARAKRWKAQREARQRRKIARNPQRLEDKRKKAEKREELRKLRDRYSG